MAEKEIIEKIRKIQQEKVSPEQKNDLINNLLQSLENERYTFTSFKLLNLVSLSLVIID